jgi:hypothetical protein
MIATRIQLPQYSMFTKTLVYEVGGQGVFGLLRDTVVPDPTDIAFTVPPGGVHRLDLISYQFYGTPQLWWVIAAVNNIVDPLYGAEDGTQLRIPTRSRLASEGVLTV